MRLAFLATGLVRKNSSSFMKPCDLKFQFVTAGYKLRYDINWSWASYDT